MILAFLPFGLELVQPDTEVWQLIFYRIAKSIFSVITVPAFFNLTFEMGSAQIAYSQPTGSYNLYR